MDIDDAIEPPAEGSAMPAAHVPGTDGPLAWRVGTTAFLSKPENAAAVEIREDPALRALIPPLSSPANLPSEVAAALGGVEAAPRDRRLAEIGAVARRVRDFAWAPILHSALLRGAGHLLLAEADVERAWDDAAYGSARAASTDRGSGRAKRPTGGLSSVSSLSSQSSSGDETPIEPWPEPPAEEAFAGLAGRFVRCLEPHTEADPAALLATFILGFGSLVGRTAYVLAEADRHYANEFGVLVGQTSKGRKGTSLGRVKQTLEAADPDWVRDRMLGGLSSGEGLIWAVRNPITKHEPLKQKGRVVDYQDVEVDAGVADKRLFVVESEFASVLKRMQRDGNTLSATMREAWDHGNLSSLTKNSPAKATGAHVSILAHVTKTEVLRLIEATDVLNGFMNRFLWFAVRRSKCLPDGGQPDADVLTKIGWHVRDAVVFARTLGEVRRDAAAAELWAQVYPRLSEGLPGLLGAATGRAEAHVLRLALIYALLDKSKVIGASHLESALALWDYCFRSARYVFGAALADPLAEEVRSILLRVGAKGALKSDLYVSLGGHVEKHELDVALVTLHAAGLAHVVKVPTGGRPAERWFAGTPAKEAKEAKKGVAP